MKFKGKIIQIITEEKNKNYGLPMRLNTDWLDIRPNYKFKKRGYFIFLGLFISGIAISFFLKDYTKLFSVILLIFLCGIGLYILYKEGKYNKKLFDGFWYLEYPFPIEKPHDFNVNDIVDIEIKIEQSSGDNGKK